MLRKKTKCSHEGEKEVTIRVFVLCDDCHVIIENIEYTKFMARMKEEIGD